CGGHPVQDRYDPKSIEPRWQDHWAKKDLFRAGKRPGAPKKYVLAMLPYPSGEMHMGHARVYSITDVLARYARKRGFDVLHPFGWDSFGLPAENAAIKEGVHPAIRTPKNIKSFKEDVIALGISIDWTTEITTSEPEFYKWNQWFFLRMLERGLVYRRRAKVNYCPVDNTVLANEQVEDGRCWRCGTLVIEREIPVWVANFVLAGYGTGAVMSVPAHDQRDFEFAVKYSLPIRWVIRPGDDDEVTQVAARKLVEEKHAFTDYGFLFESGEFSGMPS